ncbi:MULTISPECIES: GAF domain-containing protein [unclassified Streptomyces]|uniref:GAF domain-containing protein n=1 Tax=unclassified Streptomyces TaxID=2593676 RepID=UPI002E2EFB3C|nr:GAF domain-containing protein [Streptomyces sp. NBC_01358]MEE4495089.1 GAF domain-containing protein [Streptomyces sp. BE230]WSW65600.1 GAF domain-containing protein [Streptomyces sp. NBC_00995]
MPTFNAESGRHDPLVDHELDARLELLHRLGLDLKRPIPGLDALADSLAEDSGRLTGHPDGADGYFSMVNIITRDQHFVGLHVPSPTRGQSQTSAPPASADSRSMPLNEGWCVYTLDRRKALPLPNVLDYPRWAGNPAINKLGVESYLGAPLVHKGTGITLGTVCVVGREETQWGLKGVELVKSYAERAGDFIDELSRLTQQ